MGTKMNNLRTLDDDTIDKRIAETNARLDALGAEVEALVEAHKRECEPQQRGAPAPYNGRPKDYANGRDAFPLNRKTTNAAIVRVVSPARTAEQQHGQRQMNCQTKRQIDELLRQIVRESTRLLVLKKETRARNDEG